MIHKKSEDSMGVRTP